MRWEARRELRTLVEPPAGSFARRAVQRLTLRHRIVVALRSPLVPVVAAVAGVALLAAVLAGVALGVALTAPMPT